MRIIILLAALVVSACDQQPSPLAPSATFPTPVAQAQVNPAPPTFGISISTTEGQQPFVNEPWNGSVSVTSSDGALGPPASVELGCDDRLTLLGGFLGRRPVVCVFPTGGDHVVTATVIDQRGVTNRTSAPVRVRIFIPPDIVIP